MVSKLERPFPKQKIGSIRESANQGYRSIQYSDALNIVCVRGTCYCRVIMNIVLRRISSESANGLNQGP